MSSADFRTRLQQLATRARDLREEAEQALERQREESYFNHDDSQADVEADRRRATFGVIAGDG